MSGLLNVVSDPVFAFAAEVAAKSAAVLAVGALAGFVLRSAHPAARHRAWALALLLAAALPVLVVSLPGLPLPSSLVARFSAAPEITNESARLGATTGASPARTGSAVLPPAQPTGGRALEATSRSSAPRWPFAAILAGLWGAGCVALLARLAAGLVRARAVARRGRPIDVPEFREAIDTLGISRKVRLLECDDVRIPMTGGTFRPVLLVPSGFTDWTPECRRLVLLHELAHVRRGDFLLNLGCDVALAFHWLQPLAWLAARRVREEAEVAADAVVIGTGAVPSTYASHLLAIVQGHPMKSGAPVMTVAMGVHPIERRLRTILSPGIRRSAWRGRPVIPAFAVALTAILAATRLGATPVEQEKKREARPRSESADQLAAEVARATAAAIGNPEGGFTVARNETRKARSGEAPAGADAESDDPGGAAFARALELHEAQDYQRAIEAWQEAIRLGYRVDTASYNLACSAARLGDVSRAIDALRSAIDAGFEAGDYLDRDQDLASLRSDPRFRKLRDEYGNQDRERALAQLDELEQAGARDFDRWYELGQELHQMGEYDAAVRAWRKCLEADPKNSNATYNLACSESLKGDADRALKELERAVELGFANSEHLAEDADLSALHESERFQALLERARALDLPDGAVSRGDSRPGPEVWREAKVRYERQLELHPDSGRAWFDLGFARLRLGESSAAVEAYRTAFEKGYRPGPSAYNVACAYAAMNDANHAFEWLDRARAAGLEVDAMAAGDPDLEKLRSDPRFPKSSKEHSEMKRERQMGEWKVRKSDSKIEEY